MQFTLTVQTTNEYTFASALIFVSNNQKENEQQDDNEHSLVGIALQSCTYRQGQIQIKHTLQFAIWLSQAFQPASFNF